MRVVRCEQHLRQIPIAVLGMNQLMITSFFICNTVAKFSDTWYPNCEKADRTASVHQSHVIPMQYSPGKLLQGDQFLLILFLHVLQFYK